MNMLAKNVTPEIGELNVSNHLIGDAEGLKQAWERDGYWFFRDVLDKDVIAQIRKVYVDYLVEMGLTDPDDPQHLWNGKDYSDLPVNSNHTKLNDLKAHKLLHEAPTINAFFNTLFGCDPFWVPFTVHRTNPPVKDVGASRFDFIHDDGSYNEGLPFLICWVPIFDIPPEAGGLAVLEGLNRQPSLHRREGMKILPIVESEVPAGHWRTAHYRPGDVLLMDLRTPHSGMKNISKDQFRMSLDTRIMPSSGNCPLAGAITAVSADGVTLATANGERSLRFDDTSFVRGMRGDRMPLADIPGRYNPGDEVIVAFEGDVAKNMRPQH